MAVRIESSGGRVLRREVDDRCSLCDDAETIANWYADKIHYAPLRQPLEQFLTRASGITGLDAIALALWHQEATAPNLAVFAVANAASIDEVSGAISEVFGDFDDALAETGPNVSTGLWYVNSKGRPLQEVIPRLKHDLKEQLFFQSTMAAPELFTVARTTPG